MKLLKLALVILLAAVFPLIVHGDVQGDAPSPTRIIVFYDSRQQPHILWPYEFRVMVVEDLVGSGGQCWVTLPNGTVAMDYTRCRPLANTRLRVTYAELLQSVELVTGEDGVASSSWRIFTYPSATFRVEVYVGDEAVKREFPLGVRWFTLASVAAFSVMLSSMIYAMRRGMW
ncbi:MAG: hypothetical protein QW074_03400 [Candidatus Caldarchaeum sp.]